MSPEAINMAVAAICDVPVAALSGIRRTKRIAEARQIAMWLHRKLRKDSYPEIGRNLGGRDHSTVIHACRRINRRLAESALLRGVVTDIGHALGLTHIALPSVVQLVPEYVPKPEPTRYVLTRDRMRRRRVIPHQFAVAYVAGRPVDWSAGTCRQSEVCIICGFLRKGHDDRVAVEVSAVIEATKSRAA